ncbi:hypothetical protein [Mesorhizobium sp. RMAD-H1]|uniref:hypothetical protein n=1 Tax=Mesorhizobium sp. RMAD-H1 TaxID=2587065 RepID=UPI00161B68CB|nr:hypothetical protein [Mesorhizobium sp. RMAD-H1]MBB2973015.1 hypothetical protein [Mesorhizobium sp. RMAD-H1]
MRALIEAGDTFIRNGLSLIIVAVNSDTSITLTEPWTGAALSGATYRIRRAHDASRYSELVREPLTKLFNCNIEALSGLTLAAGNYLRATGPGVPCRR